MRPSLLDYWRSQLEKGPLQLPTDRPRPPQAVYRAAAGRRRVPAELVALVLARGEAAGAPPILTYLAPFLALLSRLSGQTTLSVGVAGRAVGASLSPLTTADLLLADLRASWAEALDFTGWDALAAELGGAGEPASLWQAAFDLGEQVPAPAANTRLELELFLAPAADGGLELVAFYAAELFDAATIDRWLELYELLLREFLATQPGPPLEAVALLTASDRALYAAVNANATTFPPEASLAAIFSARAAAFPDFVAIEYRDLEWTYAELESHSNRLAHLLRARGARPGSMVGLCFERGLDLAATILAVVKTGAAYVPLDGGYPEARLRGMVEDTAMPLLLGSAAQVARLPALGVPALALEALAGELASHPATPLPPVPGGLAPAVVIFTSGSTGKPKGVVVTQRAICRLVIDTNYIAFAPGDLVTQVSAASFDVYTFEIWGAFLHGGCLWVIDRETLLDPRAFAATIAGRDIAAMFLTVALFTQMMLEEPQAFTRVRHLMFGGEACEPSVVRRALEFRPAHLQNGYGPAECTTYATTCDVFELAEDAGSVPIGKPVANTEVLVLDRCGQPAGMGVAGELCLGGPGLALGYWRRPALTAQVFVPHPCAPAPGERLYRTGDLARLLPSGDFDYLGRIDFQVKVRGYRIELGEVEAVLGRHPAVREKIALTQGKGPDQQLIAFVVVQRDPDGRELVTAEALRDFAAATLPAFAVPRIHLLPAMPITPNGKIDRRALPDLSALRRPQAAQAAPQGELEEALAAQFAALLGLPAVGRDDDFFELGGHSLLAGRLKARLEQQLGIELAPAALFAAPTVAALASAIAAGTATGATAPRPLVPQVANDQPQPLGLAQERLYFLYRFEPESPVYNIPAAWSLSGPLDTEALRRALALLDERHPALRTRYLETAGAPHQRIDPPAAALVLEREEVPAERLAERLRELAEQPFDLAQGRPWRCRLLATGKQEHSLFLAFHHIGFDGLSLDIFARELAAAYAAQAAGTVPELPALPFSYADFAVWQRQRLDPPRLAQQIDYWRRHLDPGDLELPTDLPRPAQPSFRGAAVRRALPADLVRRLEALGRHHGATPFLAFLAPFLALLSRLSGQERIQVGVPFAGRDLPGTEELVGFFVNTLVLGARVDGAASWLSLVKQLRSELAGALAHQEVPFEKLVSELRPRRDASRNPLFQTVFQLFEGDTRLPDWPGLTVQRQRTELRASRFDFELMLTREPGGGIEVEALFATDLFRAATLERWLELYQELLEAAAAAPERPLAPGDPGATVRRPARPAAPPAALGPAGRGGASAPQNPLEARVAAAFAALLGRDDISREDDFFSLGGHSLLATRLLAKLRELTGAELPVRQLFATPTVAGLAAAAAASQSGAVVRAEPGGATDELSFAQQRLYFLHRFSPESPVYNLPAAWRLRGPLDRAALAAALAAVETRQEILRTRFRDQDGVPRAVLLPAGQLELPGETVAPAALAGRLRELAAASFDLLAEKPWRCRLLTLGENDHVLFVCVHHIAFDGLSLGVFANELAAAYRQASGGTALAPAPLAYRYADYAADQKAQLAGGELERQLEFWRRRVPDEPLELPTDRPRPPVQSFRGGFLERELELPLVRRIEELGRSHGASPFLAFLAPFAMLLARLCGQSRVCLGVPLSGRHSGEVDELIGFFINTLLLGAELGDDPAYETLLPRLRREFAEVFAHQDLPFEKLVEELGMARDASRNPLYQVSFQLFEPVATAPDFGSLRAESLEVELPVAKFDLDLLLERRPDGHLKATLWYAADLFEAATVAGWLELYEILLREVAAAPQRPLSQLPLLRPADRALYHQVNANRTDFPRESHLAHEFAGWAARQPQAIAAEFRGQQLTYGELDRRTNRLARRLRGEGIEPGAMVGVCIERSLELVVAILAIVKTGSAYVPLDADYPEERLAGMVSDTRMPLVLAGTSQKARLPAVGARVLELAALEAAAAAESDGPLPALPLFAESAANVIFTSGSTGRPKGVVVTHRGVLRLVRRTNYIDLRPGDVVVQAASSSFDVYTFEIWGALANGGYLLVVDRDTLLRPRAFAELLAEREVAALFLTVTLFSQMVQAEPRAFVRVRHLFFGGEACEPSVVRRALENPPRHLQNGYGPTECTCYANVFEVETLAGDARSVPIGKPVANTEALVLDRWGQIASVGVHGELCLGGDGLAWGYWRRPATTAAAFVPHPASPEPGARLYRTGDLARLLPSGDFDYLGRIDFQVKVRGFRIELGEIEAVLGRHPEVREKIALTRGQGADQLLVAFVVVRHNESGEPATTAEELQRYCAAHLPSFAVPLVRILAQMPITPNGKIDRRALPQHDLFATSETAGEAPRDAFERLIAEVWEEVLGVHLPSREADFFSLGGHSLAAMRILSALQQNLGVELPLPLLFAHPALADFAAAARNRLEASAAGRELLEALAELDTMDETSRAALITE